MDDLLSIRIRNMSQLIPWFIEYHGQIIIDMKMDPARRADPMRSVCDEIY